MHISAAAILLVLAAAIQATPSASVGTTAAARFWEQALPGTPMPEVIADLVQRGIDQSPLQSHSKWQLDAGQKPPRFWTLRYNDDPVHANTKMEAGLFFLMSQVHVGGAMTVSFPPEAVPAILPRNVAEKVRFSSLDDIFSLFNITLNSAEAAMVNDTMRRCQAPDHHGEQKICATSLEDTVQSAVRMLGASSHHLAWAMASKGLPPSGDLPLQSYMIEAIRELDGDHNVGCHVVPFPYAVYHCHTMGQPTKVSVISLRSQQGLGIDLAAICHLNTTTWNPAYPAFEILHARPGGAPVCHFMGYANLVFGQKV